MNVKPEHEHEEEHMPSHFSVKVEGGYLKLKRSKPPGPGGGNGNGNGGNGGDGEVTGITPEVPTVLPDPPPGLWPPPTPGNPIVPVPAEAAQTLPPGGIWPRPEGDKVHGHFCALIYIPEHGWHYVIVDPDAIAMPQIPRPEPQPAKK